MTHIRFGEINSERFYKIPVGLFHNVNYKGMSADAKILYALMRSRLTLSIKNGWSDENGDAFIYFTVGTACDYLEMTPRTAVKKLKELIDFGLIEKRKQGIGKPDRIYINKLKEQTFEEVTYNMEKPMVKSIIADDKKYHRPMVKSIIGRWQKVSSNKIEEKKIEMNNIEGSKSASAPSAEIPLTVNDYFSQFSDGNKGMEDVLHQFSDFRKKMRKPLTPYAAKLLLQKLHDLSNGDQGKAAAIVNQSIMNGWQGLFPLKSDHYGKVNSMEAAIEAFKRQNEEDLKHGIDPTAESTVRDDWMFR